jgi:hypothetical protein
VETRGDASAGVAKTVEPTLPELALPEPTLPELALPELALPELALPASVLPAPVLPRRTLGVRSERRRLGRAFAVVARASADPPARGAARRPRTSWLLAATGPRW